MRHCLVAQCLADNDADQIQTYRVQWGIEDGESNLERYRGAYTRATERVMRAWREMPGTMLYYFLLNVRENMRVQNAYVGTQIPVMDSLVRKPCRLDTFLQSNLT